jgi:DNA-binding CsgD family transcriptional regulator
MTHIAPLPQVAIVSSDLKLRRVLALEASRIAQVASFSEVDCFLAARRDPIAALVLVVDQRWKADRFRDAFASDTLVPILSLCAEPWPDVINCAHELGWRLLCQPLDGDRFGRYLQSLVGGKLLRDHRLSAALQEMSMRWSLTARQSEVLSLALHGERPGAIADALGVSHSTFRSHSRGLLLKSGTSTIAMAAHRVLLRALEMRTSGSGATRTGSHETHP